MLRKAALRLLSGQGLFLCREVNPPGNFFAFSGDGSLGKEGWAAAPLPLLRDQHPGFCLGIQAASD